MKRLVFSICVSFMIFFLSNCDDKNSKLFVDIPDANFKTYLLENFDKNKDGRISVAEAKKIKKIDCTNKDIESLMGIQQFSNLTSLVCSNNRLDEVDVSYNKKISWLDTRNNNYLVTIYFAESSPLSKKNLVRPKANETPDVYKAMNPIDDTKCRYDIGKTQIVVRFK